MTRALLASLAVALLAALSLAAQDRKSPGAAPSAKSDDFAPFRLLTEKNIFDPNRIGRSTTGASEAPPPPDTVITLVGTLQSGKGLFAFFDSNDSKYARVLAPGAKLAGFTLTRVAADSVDLDHDGTATHLNIAQQLRRPPGDGAWSVFTPDPDTAPAASTSAPSSAVTSSSSGSDSPAPTSAEAADALRRLLEKRRKQLNE